MTDFQVAAKPYISFWWDGADYIGGFSLQSDTMRRLTGLSQRIHFHYIYPEEPDSGGNGQRSKKTPRQSLRGRRGLRERIKNLSGFDGRRTLIDE